MPVAVSEVASIVAVLPPLLPAWVLRYEPPAAGGAARRVLLEAFELRRDRLDACGHVPPLGEPVALLLLERRELGHELAGILALEPAFRLLEPALEHGRL